MTDTSQAPLSPLARRAKVPSWLDLRLVSGVILVLAAIAVGASVISAADHRQSRWALTRTLSAGTILTAADIKPVRVQLGGADSNYLPVTEAVVGRELHAGMRAGQLLPRSELVVPTQGIAVTISLRASNAPTIVHGDRVVVWVSTKSCQAVVLLSDVLVQSVEKSDGSAFGSDAGTLLVVRIPVADAQRVVSAEDLDGAVIRVGVLSDTQPQEPVDTDLGSCSGAGK